MPFQEVCKESDLEEGKGKVCTLGDKEIAVFNVDGEFRAIDNSCPHAGGPLGEGSLENGTVTCPLHAWEFDTKTGCFLADNSIKVQTYPVKVEDGKVMVDLG